MKKLLLSSSIIALAFSLAGCRKTEMKNYNDKDGTIAYPSDWELTKDPGMGASFMIKSPQESALDLFQENVNLMVQDLSASPMDLAGYTDLSIAQIKSMMQNAVIIDNETKSGKAGTYQLVRYSAVESSMNLEFEQYYILKGNSAYILTFTADHDKFDKYKETAEQIMNSFEPK